MINSGLLILKPGLLLFENLLRHVTKDGYTLFYEQQLLDQYFRERGSLRIIPDRYNTKFLCRSRRPFLGTQGFHHKFWREELREGFASYDASEREPDAVFKMWADAMNELREWQLAARLPFALPHFKSWARNFLVVSEEGVEGVHFSIVRNRSSQVWVTSGEGSPELALRWIGFRRTGRNFAPTSSTPGVEEPEHGYNNSEELEEEIGPL
ncbi:hypothetical protein BC830DRAFT_1082884 [Chytriomyces sp. MP71]|nr:hypothetical protein BC830DRAFT_1082884 [Chytriomyces sp. MP71]